MKRIAHVWITTIVTALLVCAVHGAVTNVSLQSVGESGVSGTATVIIGNVSGANPFVTTEISIRLNKTPSANTVYEGWLVDNDSKYKLSLGAFARDRLVFRQHLVDFTPYDAIAVSAEPTGERNPMPSTIVAMGNLPGTNVSAADFARLAVLPEDEMFQEQIVAQRFGLTAEQVRDLRMMAWSYPDIAVMANAAARCNKPISDIANMLMQGQSWEQIASSCKTTVAQLLEPVPIQAVAGYVGEVRLGAVQPMTVYRIYPNGRPVVTLQMWEDLHARGYTWQDVAVAANIAAITGDDLDTLLRMRRIQGLTWTQIAMNRQVPVDKALDITQWPFSRNGEITATPSSPTAPAGTAPPMSPPESSGSRSY